MPSSHRSDNRAPIAPAVKALLIQIAAVSLAASLLIMLHRFAGFSVALLHAALLAGVVAAAISRWYRLDWWWLPIQLGFMPALIIFNSFALPPAAFLLGFVLLLAVFWSTYRTRVPLFSSTPAVWASVADLLPAGPLRGVDIGSGLGGAVLALSRQRQDCRFIGVELAPLPWLISVLRARWQASSAQFCRRDYAELDLGSFDVVFAYLSPAAMPALWQQARRQMRAGALLISYEFSVEPIAADIERQPLAGGPTLFVYYPNGKSDF